MPYEVRSGFRRDRIVESGIEWPVVRERGGWHRVPIGPGGGEARVRYDIWRDRIEVRFPAERIDVRFGWARGSFEWDGRRYRVRTSLGGRVEIESAEGVVFRARHTLSGLRVDDVSTAIERIARPLAFGLHHRAQWQMAIMLGAHG